MYFNNRKLDIRSKGEITDYLIILLKKDQIKDCRYLKIEEGYPNTFTTKCNKNYASRIPAINVHTDPSAGGAPSSYSWPKCPENCAFYSKSEAFIHSLNSEVDEIYNCKSEKVIKKDRIKSSNEIFIVHGHDEEIKQAVARTVEKLDLKPIILLEKANKGQTIIEKFESYVDVNFAIAILSPDDIAYQKDKLPKDIEFRARQNVIFELGFFVAKLGREHVFVLYRETKNFIFPSDYYGIGYTTYDTKGQWRLDLIKELNSCGYNIDANKLIEK